MTTNRTDSISRPFALDNARAATLLTKGPCCRIKILNMRTPLGVYPVRLRIGAADAGAFTVPGAVAITFDEAVTDVYFENDAIAGGAVEFNIDHEGGVGFDVEAIGQTPPGYGLLFGAIMSKPADAASFGLGQIFNPSTAKTNVRIKSLVANPRADVQVLVFNVAPQGLIGSQANALDERLAIQSDALIFSFLAAVQPAAANQVGQFGSGGDLTDFLGEYSIVPPGKGLSIILAEKNVGFDASISWHQEPVPSVGL